MCMLVSTTQYLESYVIRGGQGLGKLIKGCLLVAVCDIQEIQEFYAVKKL